MYFKEVAPAPSSGSDGEELKSSKRTRLAVPYNPRLNAESGSASLMATNTGDCGYETSTARSSMRASLDRL